MVAGAIGPDGYGVYQISWENNRPVFESTNDEPDVWVIPGFVDVHLHGAFGIDLMTASRQEIHGLCERLEDEGYEGFLATTVTSSFEGVTSMIENLPDHFMILGIHLEGPFISKRYPGAQPVDFILDPAERGFEWEEILMHPHLRIVTLAPELPGSLELIQKLKARGVKVSIGHTNATYKETEVAFLAGADHVTHMFNAMIKMHHRELGVVGYVLLHPFAYHELIYDRHHVSKEAAKLLLKNVSPEKIIGISDSTAATGLSDGSTLSMWGHECEVQGGKVVLKNEETLAGSRITMLNAYQHLAEDFGDEVAMKICCCNPRKALGMKQSPKVWLVLDKHRELVDRRISL